jgi:hypothetical protein
LTLLPEDERKEMLKLKLKLENRESRFLEIAIIGVLLQMLLCYDGFTLSSPAALALANRKIEELA